MKKQTIIIILILALLFSFVSCSLLPSDPSPVSSSFFAMDTIMDLKIYSDSDKLIGEIEAMVRELENKYSTTNESGYIYNINNEGFSDTDAEANEIFKRAFELCEMTDGALDISILPLVEEWGFTSKEYKVPSKDRITDILKNVDFRRITITEKGVSVEAGMKIDLGSVLKGYTSSKIIDFLHSKGIKSAIINLGGNVHALGRKPDGSLWNVGIKGPFSEDTFGILKCENKAIITSGGYERYFEEDGKTYWHILDPSTGTPADSGLVSVTVIGTDGMLCDGLSTAFFVMGLDKAISLWKNLSDIDLVLVDKDKNIYVTEGIKDLFSLSGNYSFGKFEVITRD